MLYQFLAIEMVGWLILEATVVVLKGGFSQWSLDYHLIYFQLPSTPERLVLLQVLVVGFLASGLVSSPAWLLLVISGMVGSIEFYQLPIADFFPTLMFDVDNGSSEAAVGIVMSFVLLMTWLVAHYSTIRQQ